MSRFVLDVEDLVPGMVIRIGLGGCEEYRRSIFFRLTEVGATDAEGRIELTGQRLTSHGRAVEDLTLRARIESLHPEVMA